ncbi:MAG: exodeoxyribonuclease VII small subunit [Endomicrobiales bacterium]
MNKNVRFEEGMERLEKIVEEMERSDMDLDKSLALFEEGIKLVRFCSSKLEESKKKVEILVKKGQKMVPEPFAETEETSRQGEGKELFK